ncbi:MAG: butyrate kinase [Deferrisomatales bacterium]|nr:butyrate kinase [Deferrisomatales bacterium]
MNRKYKVFAINPGSTSTKVALFENDVEVFSANVFHDAEEFKKFEEISDQLPYRKATILEELAKAGVSLEGTDAFAGRSGGFVGLAGGTYAVNDTMLHHGRIGFTVKHPANLGCQLAREFASEYGGVALVVNPPDVDEFEPIARVCGFADVERESKGHPLNQKEVAQRYAAEVGKRYEDLNLVVSHMGGGVSVTAHRKGRMVDSTDVINGDGPMAPTRAGALPATAVVKLCFSGKFTEREMYNRITKNGGLTDHLETADVREVRERAAKGDAYAGLVFDAMLYQVAKYIGAYAAVLKGEVDAILLTGGIAQDPEVVERITERVRFIAPVRVYPGELEMEALAAGAIRVLSGREEAKTYTGVPVWGGFPK